MSFRFWQRIRLAPWVTLNLSKSSASVSFGPPGAKYTIGPNGHRVTAGLPGSGLFYSVHVPSGRQAGRRAAAPPTARERLDLGFLRRLLMPAAERSLVEGLLALHDGDETTALAALERAAELPDAAWLAGVLRLKRDDLAAARAHLEAALAQAAGLGAMLKKYGLLLEVTFPVAPDVIAHAQPAEQGTRLALVEIAQLEQRPDEARGHLERLLVLTRSDVVVQVSFAELVLDRYGAERALIERIVALTADVANESPVHTALLLYRGRALVRLGLDTAAQDVFTLALRRRADRPAALLHQIRYERAALYERLGRRAQARQEFERLYAEAPDFMDVKQRLGLG